MGARKFTHRTGTQRKERSSALQRPDRRLIRRRPLLALASLTVALVAAGIAFAAAIPPAPTAPSITSRPDTLSNQTSAHFTYADSQPGVSFQCQLDASPSFSACPAGGITYAGPLGQGGHTFKVRALVGTKTSSATSATWTVDTTPPSPTLSFPVNASTLSASNWNAGCSGHGAICGRVKDQNGVHAVLVSIRRGNGNWWGGKAFDQTSESFRTATLSSPDRDSSDWTYAFALPADGPYTIHVRALDDASNTTPASAQASATFTIDTTPPPAPTVSSGPPATTTAKTASFTFADSEPGSGFQCGRDGQSLRSCASPRSYTELALGTHVFRVAARDSVGNLSASASYSWTIVKTLEGKPFTVSGGASGPLAPGLSRAIAVTVSNPNNVPINVTSLSVSVAAGSTKAGCDGPSNLQLTQSNLSATNTLTVPANGALTLPSGAVAAPQVLMKDLATNQDACKNASFTFNYSGSAHS
jgi:hypothetical protein